MLRLLRPSHICGYPDRLPLSTRRNQFLDPSRRRFCHYATPAPVQITCGAREGQSQQGTSSASCPSFCTGELIVRNSRAGEYESLEIIQAENPSATVVVVPGNPGVCSYYKEFLHFLSDLLPPTYNLICHGLLGHGGSDIHSRKFYTLKEQTELHCEIVKNIDGSVILVGHSIGTHMALAAKLSMPEKVIAVVGLQPFLQLNDNSHVQNAIGLALQIYPLCVAVAALGGLFGTFLNLSRRWFVKRICMETWGHSQTAADLTSQHMARYYMLRNVFHMGWTEFCDLSLPENTISARAQSLKEHWTSIGMVFIDDDHWAPVCHMHDLAVHAPQITTTLETPVQGCATFRHDFVTTTEGSCYFAKVTLDVLHEMGPALLLMENNKHARN